MNFRWKRRLTYGTIAFFFLCGGVEYGVVFPTIWSYLQHLGARDETFLGLSVASFSVSAIIIGPVIGKWFDKTRDAKIALLVTNVFEIGGSIMYFAANSPWFVVFSRFVCGIGSGAAAAIFADIALGTLVQDRTAIMTRLSACRQVGLMTGPAFSIFFQKFHFDLFSVPVNPMTSPGLFMAALGVVVQCLFLFAYFNLGNLKEQEILAGNLQHSYVDGDASDIDRTSLPRQPSRDQVSINREVIQEACDGSVASNERTAMTISSDVQRRIMGDVRTSDTNGMIESADDFIANSGNNNAVSQQTMAVAVDVLGDQQSGSFEKSLRIKTETPYKTSWMQSVFVQEFIEEFIRHEVVAILGLTFISYFAQTSFETIATPLTQSLYNFGAYENSIVFMACGLEILLAFLIIAWISKYFEDRFLLLIGIIFLAFAMSWLLYFVPNSVPGDKSSGYYIVVGVVFDILGIALLVSCGTSLCSKLISKERQGLGQGLRRSWMFAGTILGPLWAGAVMKRPVLLFAVPLGLVLLMLVLLVLSYSKLREPVAETRPVDDVDERTPLINSRS